MGFSPCLSGPAAGDGFSIEDATMRLCDILCAKRILVDSDGGFVRSKTDALRILGHMLSDPLEVGHDLIEAKLEERENLQSTGIGTGVAIPHTSLSEAPCQAAGLLICPHGVPFDAIDGKDVTIIVGVVGPKSATGDHLRVLARISRLLRDASTRMQLLEATGEQAVFDLVQACESS